MLRASQSDTAGEVKRRACALFGLAEDAVELWDFFRQEPYANLEASGAPDGRPWQEKTLADCRITFAQVGWVGTRGGRPFAALPLFWRCC